MGADATGDGRLSRQEFRDMCADPRVKAWLSSMELDVREADLVYTHVDENNDDLLTPEELVKGFSLLRGPARSLDMITSMRQVDAHFTHLKGQVEALRAHCGAPRPVATIEKKPDPTWRERLYEGCSWHL